MNIEILKNRLGNTKTWYRVSVSAFYFIQGLVFATWASRIPDIKNLLGMNEAMLGGVLFFIPAGQMTAMALSGWSVSKYGSKRMLLLSATMYSLILILLGSSTSIFQLSVSLFLFGMSANLFNIAINTQAIGVERLYGRSIMASFHGLWSLAGLTGGLISTLTVALDISTLIHFVLIVIIFFTVLLSLKNSVLPRDEQQSKKGATDKKVFIWPDRYVIMLGFMAFGTMICEGTMFDWSSVYFEQIINPPKNLIRLGYIAAMFGMTGGRFVADSFITRFGVVNILKTCGLTISTGLLISTIFPYLITATIGFLLVGIGVSAIVPITYSMAGKSKTMLPGIALAAVSTVGFLGFLIGPPIIGFIAHALNLRWSLSFIAIFGIFITALAPRLNKL